MRPPVITSQDASALLAQSNFHLNFHIVSTVVVATTDVKHHIFPAYKNGVPTSKIKPLRLLSVPGNLKSPLALALASPVLHITNAR
jgi:hypothetical protein